MWLHDSFTSLYDSILDSSFQDLTLNRSDLDFAAKKVVASFRTLADPAKISAYKDYLSHCERELQGRDNIPLLPVVANYLADANGITDLMACEKLTQILLCCLKQQDIPLDIATMGIFLIDRPRYFAAFIRFLLQRSVTVEQIFATGLLQNYFCYYMGDLNEKDNPIAHLYRLFAMFDDSLSVSELARQARCEAGGPLDGSPHSGSQLTLYSRVITPVRFTPEETCLRMLHAIFGANFLMSVLYQWDTQKNHAVWVNTVKNLFNHPDTVNTQLPMVVGRVQEHTVFPAILARILDDQALLVLFEKPVAGVLHLIPYSSALTQLVQARDLPAYLKMLQQQNAPGAALISSLFSLFNAIKNTNLAVATVVFDALLDAIHADSSVLEDTRMLENLGKFALCNERTHLKIQALETDFARAIELQTREPLDELYYLNILNFWNVSLSQIQNYKRIIEASNHQFKFKVTEFKTTFPMYKYTLFGRIAQAIIRQQHKLPDLPAFARDLRIEPVFHETNVELYERLLIELLVSVDHQALRENCIQILDANVKRPWREFAYGGQSLYQHAIEAGNSGFVRYMDSMKYKKQDTIDALAQSAAKAGQWQIAAWFHVKFPLKQDTINQLLGLAVSQGRLHEIPALWNGEHAMPALKALERDFKMAVKRNDLMSLRCFITCPQKPGDAIVASAFRQAIGLKYFDIATVIAENFSGGCLRATIEQTFKNAASLNHLDELNLIKALKIDRLDQKVIESAFLAAVKDNQLSAVKWLVMFSPALINNEMLKKARNEAYKKTLTGMDEYLATLYKPQTPSFFQKMQGIPLRDDQTAKTISYHTMPLLNQFSLFRTRSAGSLSMALAEHAPLQRQRSS